MQQLSRPYAGIKDIDATGRTVQFYGSAFGNEDSDGDIIMPGAFTKTILENGPNSRQPRIKHLLQHSTQRIIGKFTELAEDQKGLLCTSILANTKDADDALALYELDLFEHSVGFQTIKWEGDNSDPENYLRRLTELKLWEVSSVTWGANAETPLVGIKARGPKADAAVDVLNARMSKLFKALRTGNMQDATYEQLQAEADSLQTAYKGLISLPGVPAQPAPTTVHSVEPSGKELAEAFLKNLTFLNA